MHSFFTGRLSWHLLYLTLLRGWCTAAKVACALHRKWCMCSSMQGQCVFRTLIAAAVTGWQFPAVFAACGTSA
jgi:hypothetical protein